VYGKALGYSRRDGVGSSDTGTKRYTPISFAQETQPRTKYRAKNQHEIDTNKYVVILNFIKESQDHHDSNGYNAENLFPLSTAESRGDDG